MENDLREWAALPSSERGILTQDEINFLLVLHEKSLRRPQGLTDAQRGMKAEVSHRVGRAIRDIILLIKLGFIRADDRLNSKPAFKVDTWKDEIPAEYLAAIVETMVQMFGDEYALPLAKAIEEGLLYNSRGVDSVEVPVIRKKREYGTGKVLHSSVSSIIKKEKKSCRRGVQRVK